jgi:flagellar FliJ protein
MSALKSISVAIELAKVKRDGLISQLSRCKRLHANALGQMDQLASYAEETHDKWIRSSQVGVSPDIMRHHTQFMARLQEAMALQQSVITKNASDVQRAHQTFLASELRLASLEHMEKKMLSTRNLIHQRKEQKQTDEFAASRKITVFDTI